MRNRILVVAAAAFGLGFSAMALAAEEGSWTGALVDNNCGAKQKDEAAALQHPGCALKEKCAASGYQIVVGDKHYMLNDKGNEEAKALLEKVEKKDTGVKVTVSGKLEGDKIDVASIKQDESK